MLKGERRQPGDCQHGTKVCDHSLIVLVFTVYINSLSWKTLTQNKNKKTYNVGKALACKIVVKAKISKSVFESKQKNLAYNQVLNHFCRLFRTGELREKIETLNGEIQQLDMDLEEHQGKHLSLQLEFSLFTTEKRI